jgi:hypothetical protein
VIITLEIPSEAESRLSEQARARGLSLDAFLQSIITTQAAAESEPDVPRKEPLTQGEEVDRMIDDLFDTVQLSPGIGEGATRRENWYR